MAAMLKKLLTVAAGALLTVASYAAAVELSESHPDTYVVQKGDTLWDISARFLDAPWLWPEIWQANPQIENPHLIYPGDVLSLAYLGGDRPVLSVTRRSPEVRRSAIDPIPALPLSDIEPFLKEMHVLDEDELKGLPYVVGLEEDRLRSAAGQVAYVRGIGHLEPGTMFSVVRPTVRYAVHPHPATGAPRMRVDPWTAAHGVRPHQSGRRWAYYAASDNGFEVLGQEVQTVAIGQMTRAGDPATVLLGNDGHEVRAGDLLLPLDPTPYDFSFFPHPPQRLPANIHVMAVTDGIVYGGPRDVVAINAGSRDGIDNGTVFAIYSPGALVRDEVAHPLRIAANLRRNRVKLPDEFVGHVMVFRTFDKVSYGLIMDGIRPAHVGDVLREPLDL